MEFESPMQQVVRRCTNLQEQIGALEFENQRLKDEAVRYTSFKWTSTDYC